MERSNSSHDSQLMARILQRDPEALMAAYKEFGKRVFSLIYRILQDRGAAEEILQDTFWRLWDRPQQYDLEKGPLISWLLAVSRNLALDFKRKEVRRSVYTGFPGEHGTTIERLPEINVLADPLLSHTVRAAIESLPENQRSAIELAYFEGYTHAELAERLGEPLGTVKSRIKMGLSKLRDAMLGTVGG